MMARTQAPVYVYEPHGTHRLPVLGTYLRRLWGRRAFLYYQARADLKARHFDTWFGQLWVLLNPMLLASVYWLLVTVIRGSSRGLGFLTFLFGGLFTFYYTRNSIGTGAKSVVGGVGLITNTTMPRALLPLSSVLTALMLYIPTLLVYAVFHVLADLPVGPQMLGLPLIVALLTVFNVGLAMLFGTLTVYFRDTSAFLPYLLRIWLYVSPVLYRFDEIPSGISDVIVTILKINPMYPMLESWHQILSDGRWPDQGLLGLSALWAFACLVVGMWVFLAREREFAVRI
ncbi:MAG: ABC transporter permease [Actinobacteria bacterium]|nr:ABC transporter permease [Actinomycetota bacterium]